MPALVVPAVATTAMTSSARGCPSSAARSAAPVSRWFVDRHGQRPDAEHVERLAHRGVGVLAEGDERTQRGVAPAPVPRRVAGHHRGPRGCPPSRRTRSSRRHRRGSPACGGQHAERLVLGHDDAGRLQPGGAVQRRAGHEHVEEQRGLGRRGRDERQEARAVAGDHGGGQLVHEELAARRRRRCPRAASGRPARRRATRRRPPKSSGDRVHGQALAARRQDQVGHAPRRSGTSRSPSGGGPRARGRVAGRPATPPRPGSPPRAAAAPVFAATSATSSNSGLARPPSTFMRTIMPSTVTSCELAGHRPAFDRRGADPHRPGRPLDLARGATSSAGRVGRARAGRGPAGPSSW